MIVARSAGSLLASSPIWAREASLARARERASERRSREACFARPNRRARSQVRAQELITPLSQ